MDGAVCRTRRKYAARYIGVNLNLWPGSVEFNQQWQPLIDTSGDTTDFRSVLASNQTGNISSDLRYGQHQLHRILPDTPKERALGSPADFIRMRTQVNSMYLDMQMQLRVPDPRQLHEICAGRLGCHFVQGMRHRMSHGGVALLEAGKKAGARRQDLRIWTSKYFILLPSAYAWVRNALRRYRWAAVLKSVSGFSMYRKKHGHINTQRIIDFLIAGPGSSALYPLLRT